MDGLKELLSEVHFHLLFTNKGRGITDWQGRFSDLRDFYLNLKEVDKQGQFPNGR